MYWHYRVSQNTVDFSNGPGAYALGHSCTCTVACNWESLAHGQLTSFSDTTFNPKALLLQVLGENAVLVKALLEAVGTFARILGPVFATKGLILRNTLLLLLERLTDPCSGVAASAGVALGSLCLHCGYPSRQALLAGNADYLVEGLCRQLRSIETHPR